MLGLNKMGVTAIGAGLIGVVELDEAKALAATRIAVHHHLSALHLSEGSEQFLELLVGDVVAQVAYIQAHTHDRTPWVTSRLALLSEPK